MNNKSTRRPKGTGHFDSYGKGGYRLRLQIGIKEDGKPKIITAVGKTQDECWRKLKKKMKLYKSSNNAESDYQKITVAELCYKHLDAHLGEKDRLKARSADRREGTIRNQIEKYCIGDMQVASVKPTDISSHIEYLIANTALSVSSIEKTLNVLNSAYNWGIAQGKLDYNPCTAVLDSLQHRFTNISAKHTTDSDIVVLSAEETVKLKAEAVKTNNNGVLIHRNGLACLLLLETGMRIGELCALRVGDYNSGTRTLSITRTRGISKNRSAKAEESVYTPQENIVKNCHAREIALTDEAKEIIEKMVLRLKDTNANNYLYVNKNGDPSDPSHFGKAINTLYRAAGLPAEISGAHVLRRSFATNEHDKGADVVDIAAYIGDTPETVIKHYISTRKKIRAGNITKNVVLSPSAKKAKEERTTNNNE